ncbi:maleylacetoacetate isomerase [Limnohabitans sp. Rim8]|jgi:maleylpyruvate isomerase|uniref:maleylacetoacetate isomerase n=1 Tax=Limnohabitans sp. Rim8 TaxID=1100718 RepID=UPI000D3D7476|nr:maleylacetoacetate isomerase [Limnohabitans sp. Rim8]PUE62101.1 maleylacetoacetate isomerase [Limnohabitans sp. Rim8]
MKLYNFFRSGTSHRLRIALNLKGIDTDYVAVDLRVEEHLKDAFKSINPQQLVPALDIGEQVLIQSPAIIEWLEERYPTPALLPQQTEARAHVRALAALVGCDIHPINNRRILEYLRKQFGANDDAINAWCRTWISDGFNAYESLLATDSIREDFSFGDSPTLADVYLIPQIESARRFKIDLSQWPLIMSIEEKCMQLAAFQKAAPMQQIDAS